MVLEPSHGLSSFDHLKTTTNRVIPCFKTNKSPLFRRCCARTCNRRCAGPWRPHSKKWWLKQQFFGLWGILGRLYGYMVYIYEYVYIYICIGIGIKAYTYKCIYIYIYIHMYICIFVYRYIGIYVYRHIIHINVYMYIGI